MRTTTAASASAVIAACAVGGLAYAAGYEVRAYTLRRFDVPVLAPGSRPLRVLHLSDLHLTPSQRRKQRWIHALGELEPDLVVCTGDMLAHPEAVRPVLDALGPLRERPGVFVFGSNDYFAPRPVNPTAYLTREAGAVSVPRAPVPLPWRDLRDGLRESGWMDLTNARADLRVDGRHLAFAGVDDPHLGYDRYDRVSGPADPAADLAIGVAHAPYLRVLDAMAADGYGLILAGHTHGGQLCLPWFGAIVTNCDLDRARAKGLSRHPAAGAVTGAEGTPREAAWLHVSAGLGTSPYAPVRFACRPEASLLTLLPGPG